jgi:hypothetical protein
MNIIITENQLVKMLIESIDLSHYRDEDFYELFYKNFRPWVEQKYGEEVSQYPVSYLVDEYLESFAKHYNVELRGMPMNKVKNLIQDLVTHGHFKLPSRRKEAKFTEKYEKGINRLINNLLLPDFYTVKLIEKEPYNVYFDLEIDFERFISSKLTKNELSVFSGYKIFQNLHKYFEDFLGVQYGNPIHGKLRFGRQSTTYVGVDEWIKNTFNKVIKKKIKELPHSNTIHRISFVEINNTTNVVNIKIIFTRDSSWSRNQEVIKSVKELFNSLGYNKDVFDIYN